MKNFDLRIILSMTTGRLVTKSQDPGDNGIGGIYELVEHLTGVAPFTHQLPRFFRECQPYLLGCFPQLDGADIDLDSFIEREGTDKGVEAWVAVQESKFGTELLVGKMPNPSDPIDPIQELVGMVGKDRVIVVSGEQP